MPGNSNFIPLDAPRQTIMKVVLGTATFMNYKQAKNGAKRLLSKAESEFEAAKEESTEAACAEKETSAQKDIALVVEVCIHALRIFGYP